MAIKLIFFKSAVGIAASITVVVVIFNLLYRVLLPQPQIANLALFNMLFLLPFSMGGFCEKIIYCKLQATVRELQVMHNAATQFPSLTEKPYVELIYPKQDGWLFVVGWASGLICCFASDFSDNSVFNLFGFYMTIIVLMGVWKLAFIIERYERNSVILNQKLMQLPHLINNPATRGIKC